MVTSILVPKFNAASDTQPVPIQYGKMIQVIIFTIDCGPPQVRRLFKVQYLTKYLIL